MKAFLLLLLCSFAASKNTTRDRLQRGSSISVENDSHVITSPDNSFTCGFYSFQTNAFWFAIWLTNSKDRTVVWTANRNTPVNGHGSKLTFETKGVMVLTDVDDTIVWQTDATPTDANIAMLLNTSIQLTSTIVGAQHRHLQRKSIQIMLPNYGSNITINLKYIFCRITGNLVLKNQKGQIIWQSFDFPTDTLLPSQTLTKSKSLISASKIGSFASGYFGLSFNSINLTLIYDGPEISNVYWPSPDPRFDAFAFGRTLYNSSRIASFDDLGVFNSSDRMTFY